MNRHVLLWDLKVRVIKLMTSSAHNEIILNKPDFMCSVGLKSERLFGLHGLPYISLFVVSKVQRAAESQQSSSKQPRETKCRRSCSASFMELNRYLM